MRRYGVFIPERFALRGLTGQFLPQHRNHKEWVRFFVLWQTLFKQNSFRTKKLAGYEVSKTRICLSESYPKNGQCSMVNVQ